MKKETSYTLLLHFQGDLIEILKIKKCLLSYLKKLIRAKVKYTPIFLCRIIQIIFPLSITARAHYTKISLYYQAQLCQMRFVFFFAQLKVISTQYLLQY